MKKFLLVVLLILFLSACGNPAPKTEVYINDKVVMVYAASFTILCDQELGLGMVYSGTVDTDGNIHSALDSRVGALLPPELYDLWCKDVDFNE